MSEAHRCQVCGGRLHIIDAYSRLPRVTSDCKPWPAGGTMANCAECGAIQKIPDAVWLDDIRRIYGDYQIYQLSAGSEQIIFLNQGGALPRSAALISFLVQEAKPKGAGRLLDVGCGNGAALANFSRALPGWSLYGTELSDMDLPKLRGIPNFVELFTGPSNAIAERFDVISLIHSLEHMPAPLDALTDNAQLLAGAGKIFVEVPDAEASPFDLVVADHLMHFTRPALAYLAARAGLVIDAIRNDVLPKELTLLAHRGAAAAVRPDAKLGAALVERHVNWLGGVVASAATACGEARSFGIFGSSISSMWLYGALSRNAAFFVDEDKSRIGGKADGRPILSIDEIPPGSTVYIPLIPSVAQRVRDKCRARQSDCKYIVPGDVYTI